MSTGRSLRALWTGSAGTGVSSVGHVTSESLRVAVDTLLRPNLPNPSNFIKNNFLVCGLSMLEARFIAETFASESGATFFCLTSSELLSDESIVCISKVKGSRSRWRDNIVTQELFREALLLSPSVIYIESIDRLKSVPAIEAEAEDKSPCPEKALHQLLSQISKESGC